MKYLVVIAPRPGFVHEWVDALPFRGVDVAAAEQIHSPAVLEVSSPGIYHDVDGLGSNDRGPLLVVRSADCLPLLLRSFSSRERVLVHAGRKGIASGVVERAVNFLVSRGAPAFEIQVWLGPHLKSCCYRFPGSHRLVGEIERGAPLGVSHVGEELVLDLEREVRGRLVRAGLSPQRIFSDPRCTSCGPGRLPSHRREGALRSRVILTISDGRFLEGSTMAVDPQLLKILACPETKEPVSLAADEIIEKLNNLIESKKVINRGGEPVTDRMDAGLIREDGKYLYPIRDDIPIMLIEEAIELPPLNEFLNLP